MTLDISARAGPKNSLMGWSPPLARVAHSIFRSFCQNVSLYWMEICFCLSNFCVLVYSYPQEPSKVHSCNPDKMSSWTYITSFNSSSEDMVSSILSILAGFLWNIGQYLFYSGVFSTEYQATSLRFGCGRVNLDMRWIPPR